MSLRKDPKTRIIKQVLFGKKDPSRLLKWTCVLFLVWSVLMAVLMSGMGVFSLVGDPVSSHHKGVQSLMLIGDKFFFAYAALHVIIILGIMLMWRLKHFGFMLMTAGNLALVFLPYYMIGTIDFPTPSLIFAIVSIGLFAIHLGKFNADEPVQDLDPMEN